MACCGEFGKFKARRANFYVQVFVTVSVVFISGYLLFTTSGASFTAGVAMMSGVVGYWLPSPAMVRKNENQCKCEACKKMVWLAKCNDNSNVVMFPSISQSTSTYEGSSEIVRPEALEETTEIVRPEALEEVSEESVQEQLEQEV